MSVPLSQTLLRWYRRHGRKLPWRDIRSNPHRGYRIFISEMMLQQTQVDPVIAHFHRWIKQFPTWRSVAEAKIADLIHAWSGLGYNRRALFIQAAAKQVIASHEPTDETGWRSLKGVGPYAAAALAAFINHERTIVVDTNIRRVIGRSLLGIHTPRPIHDVKIKTAIRHILPLTGSHWDIPQALMDVGATICLPKRPECADCPMRRSCKSATFFLEGGVVKKTSATIRERIHDGKKFPDRIYRGRILMMVKRDRIAKLSKIGRHIDETYRDVDAPWILEMAMRLVKDGLLEWKNAATLQLPKN